jgi:hypothetical protein
MPPPRLEGLAVDLPENSATGKQAGQGWNEVAGHFHASFIESCQ